MHQLLELNRLITIKGAFSEGVPCENIRLCACVQFQRRFIAALVIGNENVLLRLASPEKEKPVVRRIPWFYRSSKKISAICFDPSGCWLLLAAQDASLYLISALHLLDSSAKIPDPPWPIDDMTTVKLPSKRSSQPTAVVWWLNANNENIAVIGNELGEISFVNMNVRMEVGGTYITVAITDMSLVHDADSTFILISGVNGVQWTLLLSRKSSHFLWPLEQLDASLKIPPTRRKLSETIFGSSGGSGNSADAKRDIQVGSHPQRLARFAGHTRLDVHNQLGKSIISGYFAPTSVLSVHATDLSVVPVAAYKLPPACGKLCLGDKLMFVTNKKCDRLIVMSVRLAETSIDGEKDLDPDSELQSFKLEPGEKVIRLFGRVERSACERTPPRNLSEIPIAGPKLDPQSPKIRRGPRGTKSHDWDTVPIGDGIGVDSCVVVTNSSLYECKLRLKPERCFLKLTLEEVNVQRAEHVAFVFSLATHLLYEKAALCKLSRAQVAPAVRFFQLAKCSHTKCVSNFAAHGFLSELIGYVRAVFSTQTINEHPAADRRRLSNLALHCYVQQILEVKIGTSCIKQSFREFLRDNRHYDEALAVRLLANEGMYAILKYLAQIRGVVTEVLRELLAGPALQNYVDGATAVLLERKGLGGILSLDNNRDYVECLTCPEIMTYLAPCPDLLRRHVTMMTGLVEKWKDVEKLETLAKLYDPTGTHLRPFLRKALNPIQKRMYGFSTSSWVSGAIHEESEEDESESGYRDALEFFLRLLVMLQVARGHHEGFNDSFLREDFAEEAAEPEVIEDEKRPTLPLKAVPLSCGFSHAGAVLGGNLVTWGSSESGRLGSGTVFTEFSSPATLRFFSDLRIGVKSVSCGNSHSLALTDIGVFGWGSSRYGQLGIRRVTKVSHPTLVGALADARIVAVSCGQYHSLAVTEDGRLLSWGWGAHGQLGHGGPYNGLEPKEVTRLSEEIVLRAAGGYGHTVALTAKGEVFAFGCGSFGQLGHCDVTKSSVPVKVRLPETVTFLTTGYFHNVAVTTSNKVYVWGCNPQVLRMQAQAVRRNRIQHLLHRPKGDTEQFLAEVSSALQSRTYLAPEVVDTGGVNSPIVQVACGSTHTVLLTADGEVFSWGRNLEGQIGNGTRAEQKEPAMVVAVNDRKMVHVACGSDFTVAVDSDNEIWGWGRNDLGQLALEDGGSCDNKPGSIQGKIITVKTNRRTIQIKKSWQSSVPKPQILPVTSSASTPFTGNGFPDFYSNQPDDFDGGESKSKCETHPVDIFRATMELSDCRGSRTLLLALKVFRGFYNARRMIRFCGKMGCLQAAAKICLLDGRTTESLHFQLAAAARLGGEKLETALAIGDFYIRRMNHEEHVASKAVLKQIMQFWLQNLLPLPALEDLLLPHLSDLAHPHGLLLLHAADGANDERESTSKLSTKFCLALVGFILQRIDEGKPNGEYLDLLAKLTELDWLQPREGLGSNWSLASGSGHPAEELCAESSAGHLWDQILRNVRQDASAHKETVEMSSRDVDNVMAEGGGRAVAFTCGHHYAAATLRKSVLPQLEAAMNAYPNTARKLMAMYEKDGFLPAACPKCVLTAVNNGSLRP